MTEDERNSWITIKEAFFKYGIYNLYHEEIMKISKALKRVQEEERKY